MKALHILIKILSIGGAVVFVVGAIILALILNTDRTEYLPFSFVCFGVGAVMVIASAILRGVANRRSGPGSGGAYVPPAAGAYVDPFGDFPDESKSRRIDPFGFDAPAAPPRNGRPTDGMRTVQPDGSGRDGGQGDKFCEHCGAKRVSDADKFCPYCGHKYKK